MFSKQPTAAYGLSWLLGALAVVAAGSGLLVSDLYRDNSFVSAAWFGNDLVTLVVAVPLLLVSLLLSRRGVARAQLLWLGMLDYLLYNFAFYLFGSALNRLFLVYAALFALSIWALILGLVRLDPEAIRQRVRFGAGTKAVGGFLLVAALGLGAAEVGQVWSFIARGTLPAAVVQTSHPTHVVAALDLTLVIPCLAVGALGLWKGHPWGYVVATVTGVKGTVYLLALTAATAWVGQVGFDEAAAELPLWGALALGHFVASLVLLASLRPTAKEELGGGAG